MFFKLFFQTKHFHLMEVSDRASTYKTVESDRIWLVGGAHSTAHWACPHSLGTLPPSPSPRLHSRSPLRHLCGHAEVCAAWFENHSIHEERYTEQDAVRAFIHSRRLLSDLISHRCIHLLPGSALSIRKKVSWRPGSRVFVSITTATVCTLQAGRQRDWRPTQPRPVTGRGRGFGGHLLTYFPEKPR